MKRGSEYLESRLSYYTSLRSLNITTGHSAEPPSTKAEAVGDVVEPEIAARCFGCHTTASTASGKFEPEQAVMGLTCEACHGPGAGHVAAMKTGATGPSAKTIFAGNKLSPVDSVDFCGACHRTPVDVAVEMPPNMGIANLRFQPYRLERSHCWGEKGDARITCVACHDPHKPLVREAAAYDAKCLACHAATGAEPSPTQLAGCKVAAKECTSCHMPRYEIPAVHAEFTDHYIRVVRQDSGFRP
jgi:hypothetical protein